MKVTKRNKTTLALTELDFSTFALLNGFPGFNKWCQKTSRTKLVRINAANIEYLMKHWPTSEWDEESNEERVKLMNNMIEHAKTVELKNTKGLLPDDSGYKYLRPPMEHQQRCFVTSRDKEAFALLLGQGAGKTKVTLDTACYLYLNDKIDMLVVIAWPNDLHVNWIEYEAPEDTSVPYVACAWSPKHKTKKAQKQYAEVLEAQDKLKIFTFNAEGFTSKAAREMITKILTDNRCLLVIDQSACIKNPGANRTKFMLSLGKLAPYRRILDGAPVAEGAEELFSQFKFLDSNIIGLDTYTAFKAQYCKIGHFRNVVGYRNLDELHSKIDGHCFRVLTEDCVDLPDKTYMKFPFALSPDEKRIFDELKKKSLTYFSSENCAECNGTGVNGLQECGECEGTGKPPANESIEQQLALVKNLRLQQISSGWWPEEGNFKSINADGMASRLKALKLLISQAKGKMIIYARFKADLHAIQDMLGDEAVSYHGDINGEDRSANKRAFKTDPKVRFIVGQPKVLGIGHTLNEAEHVVFYSNDSTLRFREESERRAYRTGLKHNLLIWDLMAEGTNDQKIVRSLIKKKKIADEILQDPENFFLE